MPALKLIIRCLLGFGWIAAAIILTAFGFLPVAVAIAAMLTPILIALLLVAMHRHTARHRLGESTRRCNRCDYELQNLPHPRCPECGALTGFRKSAEELGIGPDEMSFDNRRTL